MGKGPRQDNEEEEGELIARLGGKPVEMILVPDYGQVGAGIVVPFTPRGLRLVPRPSNTREGDQLMNLTVSGSSLIHDGIFDGTQLICKMNVEPRDVASGALAIVELPDKSLTVKHFYWSKAGYVKLVSANPDFKDSYYEEDLVRVVAVVLSSNHEWIPSKPIEPTGWAPDWEYQEFEEPPFDEEWR